MWDKAAILDQMCGNDDKPNDDTVYSKSETSIKSYPSTHFFDVDIIKITVDKINSGELNVYDDSQVSWEEVTMFNFDKIKRLLSLIDTPFIEDTADAIICAIDRKYNPTDPYCKPEVRSKYYYPSTATLWEQNDWDYEGAIKTTVIQVKEIKQKKDKYQKMLDQRKTPKSIFPITSQSLQSRAFDIKFDFSDYDPKEQLRKARAEIKYLKEKIKKLENLSTSAQETDLNIENATLTCGPYKIAPKKKTAFASVIWILKELNFFIKQEDGSYATNRSDVIDSLLTTKGNADQLLPKALKTDTFMNVFRDLLDKALEMYSKDEK